MATSKNKLEFELRLKDLATQALKNMGATVKKETAKAARAFKGMAGGGMAKAIKGFGKLAAATCGVMSGGSARRLFTMAVRRGAQDAVNFSIAMAEVSTISQEATDNLPMLSQQVLNLSTQFGLQETDAAKALYQTISSGFTTVTEAMSILDAAVVLSVGGLADLRETVDLLTNALNAYDMEAYEAERLTNIFFETVRLGKTTIPEMTTQLGLVMPVAAQLGVTIEELTAMLAALTKGGINTQIATTYMRAALVQVLNVSTDAAQLLGEKGLAGVFSVAHIKAHGFLETIRKVKDALGDDIEAMRVLVPNIRALVPILALTGNQMDDFTQILKDISTITSRQVTPAMDALERVMMSTGKKFNTLSNAMRQGFMELGMGIIEAFVGPIQNVEDLGLMAIQVREALAGLKPIVNMMIALMMTLGTVFIKVFGVLVDVISEWAYWLGISDEKVAQLRTSAKGLESVGDFLAAGVQQALWGDAVGAVQELSDKLRDQKLALIDDGLALRDFQKIVGDTSEFADFHALAEEWSDIPFDQIPEGMIAAISAGEPIFKKRLKKWTDNARLEATLMSMTLAEAVANVFTGGQGPEVFPGGKDELTNIIARAFHGSERELAIQMKMIEQQLGRGLETRRVEEAMRVTGEEIIGNLVEGMSNGVTRDFAEFTRNMTAAQREHLSIAMSVVLKQVQRHTDADVREALAPAYASAWDYLIGVGGKRMEAYLNQLKGVSTEFKDLLGADFVALFDETLRNVDPGVLEKYAPAFDSMGAALESLGMDTRMFEYSLEGATSQLDRMKVAQDIATIQLTEMERGTKEFAEAKKALAILTAQESIYAMYAEIAAMQEQGKAVVELTPKYETLMKTILATANAVFKLGQQAEESANPFDKLMAQAGKLGEKMDALKAKAVSAFAEGMAGAMMDAATGAKKFDESMKELFRNLLLMIGQAIVEMYILAAIRAATGTAAAKGAVFSGGLSEPVPLATGGVIAGGLGRALPLRAYASGGVVSGPHVALMGEGGRDEAILPLERMSGGDLGVKAAGGGTTNVNISINAVDAKGVDELLVSRQDTLRNIIRQAMMESRSFRSTMLGR